MSTKITTDMPEEELKRHDLYSDEFRKNHQINENLIYENKFDELGQPTGGTVNSVGINIAWQDGPRGTVNGELAAPNGAFIEDVIYAAMQRLAFFQQSAYAHQSNVEAVTHLREALDSLASRTAERKESGKLGKHEV